MALGDGRHKLPVKADVLALIDKREGDSVRVLLEERIAGRAPAAPKRGRAARSVSSAK
jgi:hypothetical protein